MRSPVRTCVGCGRRAPQADLARFVAPNGRLVHDPALRQPGRGAYICRSAACFERARARRAFSRTLRRAVVAPESLNAIPEEG